MSGRSAKQMEQLVKDRLPGYKLSPASSKVTQRQAPSGATNAPNADAGARSRARARVDSTTPSVADLRRKFLRAPADAAGRAAAHAPDDETDIVLVEPDSASGGTRKAKAVVFDAQGRILGAQG
jgi:hypothetical protein